MSTHHPTVAVVGAYGHTAAFVIAELRRRGHRPLLIGRDADRLHAAARSHPGARARVASLADPPALDRALSGAAAVVNCAGPFADTVPPVVDAALRAGIPYLDVAAEQAVTVETFLRYDDRARAAGVVIVPSMAFYGGLGDLLAGAAMGDWPDADEITVAIALDSWHPTDGTRKTVRRNAGRHLVFTGNRLVRPEGPPQTSTWDFPPPLGTRKVTALSTADQVTISRHLRVPEIHVRINEEPLLDLGDPATPPPTAVDADGRSAQTFVVDVVATRAGAHRRATASGRDIYAVTAPLVVEAAVRILDGRSARTGVAAAGELFDAPDFLRALAPTHLTYTGT
ncbi:saccharopine dehydrogenase family protein [Streptomyces antarcticus]|uniref:saccharopine dehydrogenase family protein n=1 Tax=Streptomyces antarcticus TaxID=2996458 RepID=UPI00226E550E|nr:MULTISPECIES: saccharopine dehydrogenase NADP-binding domain-containing protein [unclassified Streptomyces]MCY0946887.1 saccharopine dehydrogenase NADP-binding domain-containing protein [Streptomyces sp. H34-AA3]MCZ4085613.1 saccharopine dehydrogenase NADP-binding domain-containing protein [Streptomyces sp. H34-S5]